MCFDAGKRTAARGDESITNRCFRSDRVFQKMLYTSPSPQRKKETGRENKLRLFLKRSSEPLLNLQNAAERVSPFSSQLSTTNPA